MWLQKDRDKNSFGWGKISLAAFAESPCQPFFLKPNIPDWQVLLTNKLPSSENTDSFTRHSCDSFQINNFIHTYEFCSLLQFLTNLSGVKVKRNGFVFPKIISVTLWDTGTILTIFISLILRVGQEAGYLLNSLASSQIWISF